MKDKNITTIQLTEEEIALVQNLNARKEVLTEEINNVAQQRVVLNYRSKNIEKSYEEIVVYERQIATTLTQKYGKGSVDIEKGVFTPM